MIKRYKKVGYNMDITRQSACLVVNTISVYSYVFHFNSTTVVQASDRLNGVLDVKLPSGLVSDACLWLGPPWLNVRFSLADCLCREPFSLFHNSVLI